MNSGLNDLVDGELHRAVSQAGLDVEYVQASGNTLWALARDGSRIPVVDYIGGYGSLLLGHHNPEITAHAKALLDLEIPVYAPVSLRRQASEVAAALNRVIGRELGVDEPYHAVFANTGAEAVEAAVKHAELDRKSRLAELTADVDTNVEVAVEALGAGAVLATTAVSRLGLPDHAPADELVARIRAHNREQLAAPPCLITLTGGFHGKLVGSVQLTHNPTFRTPFTALGVQPRFVVANDTETIRPVFEAERRTVLDLRVVDGVVDVVEHEMPVFVALFAEPIQGEGGIVPLTAEFAKEMQAVAAEHHCPVVVDEVQSGVGRTGMFFAGARIGLIGDYIVLAKSLGGGIAKTGILLVRKSWYRPEFELVHSSTFAKDGFSTAIALKVLDLLERGGGAVYRQTAERGTQLATRLTAVQGEYPDVIADVRGAGLLLGVEFADLSGSTSEVVRQTQPAGLFGFMVSGFLLHEHRCRTMPTGSAPNTLRLEPSVGLTDEEIEQLVSGLRHVCRVIRNADDLALTAFLSTRRF